MGGCDDDERVELGKSGRDTGVSIVRLRTGDEMKYTMDCLDTLTLFLLLPSAHSASRLVRIFAVFERQAKRLLPLYVLQVASIANFPRMVFLDALDQSLCLVRTRADVGKVFLGVSVLCCVNNGKRRRNEKREKKTHEMIPVSISTTGSITLPVEASTGLVILNKASAIAIDIQIELSASSLPGQILFV